MARRSLAAIALVGIALVACDAGSSPAPGSVRAPRPELPVARRAPTVLPGLAVTVHADKPWRERTRRAVRDLRRVGLWSALVADVRVVDVTVRAGRMNLPSDGHLADAKVGTRWHGPAKLRACEVTLFPAAIKDDLDRQRDAYVSGYFAEPPDLRDFTAALVAHELAHCARGRSGEGHARAWEELALSALRTGG